MRTLPILTLTISLATLSAHPAAAQSGTQLTPDGKRALVSKDLAGQRWAISRNPDRTVTGNVFFPGGGAPQFVFCTETGTSRSDVNLSCSGADACPLGPCEPDEWLFIADVTLPLSFFGGSASSVARVDARRGGVVPSPARSFLGIATAALPAGTSAAQPAGIQITPSGSLALISKDVGDQRWAITRNEDGTVTGNVFFPDGGAPQFVWCEPASAATDPVALRCLGASACAGEGGCASDDWTLIAEVSLPASFFRARDTVSLDALAASLNAQFGEQGAFERVALALDRGYALRQVARAALSDRLQANGEIVERSGVVEGPGGQPQGIFTGTTAASIARPLGASITLQELIAKFGDARTGDVIVAVLLGLVERGYSLEQIVEELFFAGGGINVSPLTGEFELIASTGDPIAPNGPRPGVVTPNPLPREPVCGNGILEGDDDDDDGEECDGQQFDPGDSCGTESPGSRGQLRCAADCSIDISRCAKCGDGTITPVTEECDGSDLAGQSCTSLGSRGGTLKCNPTSCRFDRSGCEADCVAGGFGCCPTGTKPCNGICVPDAVVCCGPGTDVCNGGCIPNGALCCAPGTQQCGTGCIPGGADCCGDDGLYCEVGRVCVDEGCCPASSPVVCNGQCYPAGAACCGNGVREAGEACDGADVGGASCPELGSVRCTSSCTLDTTGCESRCPAGAFTCGNSCAPNGADCCDGTSVFCDGGDVCAFGGGGAVCCPGSAPTFCVGTCYPAGVVCCGSYACAAGKTCLGNNQCG